MPFSAQGDDRTVSGCTTDYPGGWWFENCLDSNLNGAFTSSTNNETTVFWRTIKTKIVKTEMKIQPYPEGNVLMFMMQYIHVKTPLMNILYHVSLVMALK
jgi:hypothetical protein